jgi:predicted tellurium resistance membrane protein TerC
VELTSPAFWTALGSIILANILLSRGQRGRHRARRARLPPDPQKKAIVLGSVAAIIMRVAADAHRRASCSLPSSSSSGGLLLLYIGVDLLLDDDEEHDHAPSRSASPRPCASSSSPTS